jgi:hypothetical protein
MFVVGPGAQAPTPARLPAPPSPAGTPVLKISGDRFTVDGKPVFLLFVSYFDAMRRANDGGRNDGDLDSDFEYIRRRGYHGIRIFPNWYHYRAGTPADDDGLFTGEGVIRAGKWPVFLRVLERASAHGLIVDVSFTRDTVSDLSVERYGVQLAAVTRALRGNYPNVLFDLHNEFQLHLTLADMRTLLTAYVRPADPDRLVTASTDSGSTPTSERAGEIARELNLDVAAHHEPRERDTWHTRAQVGAVLDGLRKGIGSPALPIYLQEPIAIATLCPPRCHEDDWSDAPLSAQAAARHARDLGAAAWTFHTRSTFDLAHETFRQILDRDPRQKAEFEAVR